MEKPANLDSIIESDPLKQYSLKFVGIGAENVCFETSASVKKLIKVDLGVLRSKIFDLLKNLDTNNISNHTYQKEKIQEYNKQQNDIKEIFGDEHVLDMGVFRSKIPLNKELIIDILGENRLCLVDRLDDDKNYEIEMLIRTQEIAKEIQDPKYFQTEDYSTNIITEDNFRNSINIQEALSKIETFSQTFLNEKSTNYKYLELIKKITKKIIQYTKKTGSMLDIFGPNNITMFMDKDNNPSFHLLDVIMPGSIEYWNKNIKQDIDLSLLRHYYTFYYCIKGLAERLGIENNLQLEDLIYFQNADIPKGEFPKIEG